MVLPPWDAALVDKSDRKVVMAPRREPERPEARFLPRCTRSAAPVASCP